MGPTNVALVKLYLADQKLREAQGRLGAAGKNVRVQERRVADLAEKLKLAQTNLREHQSKAAQSELDIKSRDARIERLRTQQQSAKNNKEYQTFLVEINTEKVDRGKVEDELIKLMDVVEKAQAEVKELSAHVQVEQAKLSEMQNQIGDTVAKLRSEVEAMRPARDAAAAALPPKIRDAFDRLADRFEGEAMADLERPDRRREEYACGACNMDLVTDVYNKLHSRDDLVFCPSCGRMLYIPEDLPPEQAINLRGKEREKEASGTPAKPRSSRAGKNVEKLDPAERRAKGKIGQVLSSAQGESVKTAVDGDMPTVECDVFLDGKFMGVYKGRDRDHLERVIKFHMDEAQVAGNLEVREKSPPPPPPEPASDAAQTEAQSTTAAEASSGSNQGLPAQPAQ
jgi:uncharacterized protein